MLFVFLYIVFSIYYFSDDNAKCFVSKEYYTILTSLIYITYICVYVAAITVKCQMVELHYDDIKFNQTIQTIITIVCILYTIYIISFLFHKAYQTAHYICPNRFRPLYQITKVYQLKGDTDMINYYRYMINNKTIKIQSQEIQNMIESIQ